MPKPVAPWSPDNIRGRVAAGEQVAAIRQNPAEFVSALDDEEARRDPTILPDGSRVARLPGFYRWIWDGEFCGAISLRWQPGTSTLPSHVLGHIGFGIVPWKRGQGYAVLALREIMPLARERGLVHVELTTTPDNLASQKTIERCSGQLVERFEKDVGYGGGEALRFRIDLGSQSYGDGFGKTEHQ